MRLVPTRPRSALGMDMTPMIDVVLQLIIFFMYTSHTIALTRTPIPLPDEPGERLRADPAAIVVDVDEAGRYFVERQRQTLAEVMGKVRAELPATGDGASIRLLVRAHRDAPARGVNTLAAALAEIGVRDWRLATSAAQGDRP
jgi:biopolymer transport protein ExbD